MEERGQANEEDKEEKIRKKSQRKKNFKDQVLLCANSPEIKQAHNQFLSQAKFTNHLGEFK